MKVISELFFVFCNVFFVVLWVNDFIVLEFFSGYICLDDGMMILVDVLEEEEF